MNKIIVKQIEGTVRIEEQSDDIIDLVAENTTDKLINKLGVTRRLFRRDAAQTRKALKCTVERLRPPFLR